MEVTDNKEILAKFGSAFYLHLKMAEDALNAKDAVDYLVSKGVKLAGCSIKKPKKKCGKCTK